MDKFSYINPISNGRFCNDLALERGAIFVPFSALFSETTRGIAIRLTPLVQEETAASVADSTSPSNSPKSREFPPLQ